MIGKRNSVASSSASSASRRRQRVQGASYRTGLQGDHPAGSRLLPKRPAGSASINTNDAKPEDRDTCCNFRLSSFAAAA